MAESVNRSLLTRREALFLSATAGVSIAAGNSALACDSIKTGVHQEPGNCSTPRSASPKRNAAKCADSSRSLALRCDKAG